MEQNYPTQDFVVGDSVIECTAHQKDDGNYEWRYKFRRCYEYNNQQQRAWTHRLDNAQDLGNAMAQAIHWMTSTDPAIFAAEYRQQEAA